MTQGYSICLNEWIEDDRIKNELRLLLKISSLTSKNGYCFAKNDYFANYFNSSTVTISRQIKKLERLGYLSIKYTYKGTEVVERKIKLISDTVIKNDNPPLSKMITDRYQKRQPTVIKNDKDNITIDNNIIINKSKRVENEFSTDVLNCFESIKKYFPEELLPKNERSWIVEIEKLNRIDKYSFKEIEEVIKKTRENDFWKKNFLSLKKLRKKDPNEVKYFQVFKQQIPTTKTNGGISNGNNNQVSAMDKLNKKLGLI